MPKYLVSGSYGFSGTDFEDVFEAEDEDSLNEAVFNFMAEKLSWGYELIEEENESQH